MIKEIIERIRQVIRKMLGKENIRDAIGVDVADQTRWQEKLISGRKCIKINRLGNEKN